MAEDGAMYFTKKKSNLSKLIDSADKLQKEQAQVLSKQAKQRINDNYDWNKITARYEKKFLKELAPHTVLNIKNSITQQFGESR